MKLTLFQSDKGDCLLLSAKQGQSGGHVLVDGGMHTSYTAHVAKPLGKLPKLDLVYVSHIDQDHISGVLRMMDDEALWRVHEFQLENDNGGHEPPDVPRPPEVGRIWHNSFHDQVGKNEGPIADLLAASASILSADGQGLVDVADDHRQLGQSVAEALRLSQRLRPGQLGIPLNPEYDGKLMRVTSAQPTISVKGMRFSVLGPFEEDLRNLRKEWDDWLRDNQARVKTLRNQAVRDEQRLGHGELGSFLDLLLTRARVFGDRSKVTAPNLASLMVLVEEGQRKVLLTGDGHWKDVLKGLDFHGKLPDPGLHLDVLKVPHHGSEHNSSDEFARKVTADHYVFCGNGAHQNPDLGVVQLYADSRFGPSEVRSKHAQVGRPFKMWFNSSSKVPGKKADKDHMRRVEGLVKSLRSQSGGQMSFAFMPADRSSLELAL